MALSLAWEACVEGSAPVGAVLCGGSGEIITIAHAEINALATLPFGWYPDRDLRRRGSAMVRNRPARGAHLVNLSFGEAFRTLLA